MIVNDGSADSTAAILEAARQQDQRVIVLTNEKNLSLIASLNRGLAHAKGAYVARMDADDLALPERLERQAAFLDTHPEIFCVGTRVGIIDERGKRISTSRTPTDPASVAEQLVQTNCMYHSSIMFRREPWVRYRSKMVHAEDYDLYLRAVSMSKKIANLDEVLMFYRLSGSSISLVHRAKQALMAAKAREFFVERRASGGDTYDAFDPQTILSLDLSTTTDAQVLREQIAGTFRANDFAETRRLCVRYVRHHGLMSRASLYFLASFLGKRVLDLKRRFYAKT